MIIIINVDGQRAHNCPLQTLLTVSIQFDVCASLLRLCTSSWRLSFMSSSHSENGLPLPPVPSHDLNITLFIFLTFPFVQICPKKPKFPLHNLLQPILPYFQSSFHFNICHFLYPSHIEDSSVTHTFQMP